MEGVSAPNQGHAAWPWMVTPHLADVEADSVMALGAAFGSFDLALCRATGSQEGAGTAASWDAVDGAFLENENFFLGAALALHASRRCCSDCAAKLSCFPWKVGRK